MLETRFPWTGQNPVGQVPKQLLSLSAGSAKAELSKKFPWKRAVVARLVAFANLSWSRWHEHAPAKYRPTRVPRIGVAMLEGGQRKEKRRERVAKTVESRPSFVENVEVAALARNRAFAKVPCATVAPRNGDRRSKCRDGGNERWETRR